MLCYSLGPFPQSLASFDGSLVKTNKAKLMHILEDEISPTTEVSVIPDGSVWIWDAMALVQQLKPQPTFGLFAEHVLRTLVQSAKATKSTEVHFVCDRYSNLSVKNAERGRQSEQGYQKIRIYRHEQKHQNNGRIIWHVGKTRNIKKMTFLNTRPRLQRL